MTFTVNPAQNGASADLSAATAIIDSDGIAQVTATANDIVGSYTATASAIGAASTASFSLKNLVALTFSGLSNPSITYGSSPRPSPALWPTATQAPAQGSKRERPGDSRRRLGAGHDRYRRRVQRVTLNTREP